MRKESRTTLGSSLRLSAGILESRADNEGTEWGHVKARKFIRRLFRIAWGHTEVGGFIAVMEVVSDKSLEGNSNLTLRRVK